MPKVLRIINRLNLGGPTFNAALLTKHLDTDFETLLVSGMKDESEASSEFILNDLGIKAHYVSDMYRSLNPLRDLPAYREIKKLIKSYKPDIIHTHAAKAGTLGRLAAFDCNVPVTLHTFHGHVFHSYFNKLTTRFFLEVERYLAKRSSKIIAISPRQKQELSETFGVCDASKISVVPLGFDLNRFMDDQVNKRIEFRQRYQLADDEVALGIVGRLVPIKNHDLFLNSLKEVITKSNKKIRAFIVGDGECLESLKSKAQALGIPFAVKDPKNKASLQFTSWIKDVDEVYAGLDIVALSSLNEGTPVSLIEAQAANKPIVSTRVGGVADIVSENKTAFLSPSEDVCQFASNLLKLVEDSELRLKMGASGRELVAQKYTYQRLAEDMSTLYRQLLWDAVPAYRQNATVKSYIQPTAIPSLNYGAKVSNALYK